MIVGRATRLMMSCLPLQGPQHLHRKNLPTPPPQESTDVSAEAPPKRRSARTQCYKRTRLFNVPVKRTIGFGRDAESALSFEDLMEKQGPL